MGVDYRKQYKPEHLEPFFPHEIIKMVIVVLCTLAILMLFVILPTLLTNAGLEGVFHEEQPADPSATPAHIRPEWYFLAVYQYLKLMPAEIMGIDGKAMGLLTQGLGMAIVLLLPFWYPLRQAQLTSKNWLKGLKSYAALWIILIIAAAIFAFLRMQLPQAYQDVLHPMYVWPVLAIVIYAAVGKVGKQTGFLDIYQWLNHYTIGLILIGVQYLTFITVLGQGLAKIMAPVAAYSLGGLLFLAASWIIVRFLVLRIRGKDDPLRLTLFHAFITEWIVLFIGLTVWAMWPDGGLYSREHGWHHETGGLIFTLSLIALVMIVFFAFLATERRTIKRTLAPEDRDTL